MSPLELLSKAEREVWERRMVGKKNIEIAAELGITPLNVAVRWSLAKARIRHGRPSVHVTGQRAPLKGARLGPVSTFRLPAAVEQRLSAEPRCSRCEIGGHLVGDPELCIPTAAQLADRRYA